MCFNVFFFVFLFKCYVVELIMISGYQTKNTQECENKGSQMCDKMCVYDFSACTLYMYN